MAEAGFDGGPEMLDGVEVGGIGWQEEQPTTGGRDQRRRGRRLMEPGVVQHDHAACWQHWQEHLFEISVHDFGVASARKGQRCHQPAVLAGGHDARPFPPLARHRLVNPFASGRTAMLTIQPMIHAALVEIKNGLVGELFQFAPEQPPLNLVPLAIFDEFFLA